MKYEYLCDKCGNDYSETRELDHPQWFTQCICGGNYVQVGDPVVVNPDVLTPKTVEPQPTPAVQTPADTNTPNASTDTTPSK